MNIGLAMAVFIGFIVGLLLVAVILKFTKTDRKMKCEFDERQALVRGKAYTYSFYVLLGCILTYGLLGVAFEKKIVEPFAAAIICICVSILVHVVYCIFHDAYFSLNENKKKLIVIFAFIGITNIVLGTESIVSGEIIKDGVLTLRVTNLACGILFCLLFVALIIKHRVDSQDNQ